MTFLGEHYYAGGFLVSEAERHRSRDGGTVVNAGAAPMTLDSGLVLAQAALGDVTAEPKAGNAGNGAFQGPIAAGLGAIVGAYTLIFTGATTFRVFDPEGEELEDGETGLAYADRLDFTLEAGTTPFVAGDGFTITVAAGPGTWSPFTAAMPPQYLGILFDRTVVQPGSQAKIGIVVRQAQVNLRELVWDPSVTAAFGLSSAAGTNTGTGTIGALAVADAADAAGLAPVIPTGTYTLTAEGPNVFTVADPTGELMPAAVVGVPYANEIAFTITAGATPFAEGDSFTITVTSSLQTQALAALALAGVIAR